MSTDTEINRQSLLDDIEISKLSRSENEFIREKMKKNALQLCDEPYVREYADCMRDQGLLGPLRCKKVFNQMNECLHQYTTDQNLRIVQLEYIQAKNEIKKEKFNL